MLTPLAYRAHIAADLELIDQLLAGLDDQGRQRPVPACPGWDVNRLVGHLGGVHRLVLRAIEDGQPSRSRDHAPADGVDLRAWFADGTRQLLAVLATDPAAPAWSFTGTEGTVGFWQRRQAMENVIHRIDAQQAAGTVTGVTAVLAADGVGEVVEVMIGLRLAAGVLVLPGHAVELVASDTGDRWVIGSGPTVGSATASAEQLFTALWKRVPFDGVVVDGDRAAVRAMLDLPLTP